MPVEQQLAYCSRLTDNLLWFAHLLRYLFVTRTRYRGLALRKEHSMQHVTTPLEITAAAWRVAGYMLETNLRVAKVLNQAAIESSPFAARAQFKAKAPTPKAPTTAAKAKPAPVKAKASKPAPATKAAPKPATKTKVEQAPAKAQPSTEPKSAVHAEASPASTPKRPAAPAPAPKAEDTTEKAKRPRAPSKPPAMPESSESSATKAKTPLN